MSTKLNPNYFVISSLLLFSSYIIYKINELYTKDINNKKKLDLIYKYTKTLGIILIIYGFIKEYIRVKKLYNNEFSMSVFICTHCYDKNI